MSERPSVDRELGDWLQSIGLGQYTQLFVDNGIDLSVLPDLTEQDLQDLGLLLGHRRKLLRVIAERERPAPAPREEGERRQLTVLFCDLVDSTSLSLRLDPEDLRKVYQSYRAACTTVAARYDGFIAQFLGDGVLVYFGYPRAHEDAAERAVRAALDMVAATSQLATAAGEMLAARAGIATGLVVVGESAADRANTAIGETPNIAARLLALAPQGEIAVADSTRRLLGGAFRLSDLGLHDVKGLANPVQAWSVQGLAATESRFESNRTSQLTSFVGREHEVATIDALRRAAWRGDGQIVLIAGEAGIGKSRFAARYAGCIADLPHTRLRCQCSPYHSTTPFFPLVEQLKRAAEIDPADSPSIQLDKLERVVALATPQIMQTTALFAALLSIPFEDRYPPLALTAAEQRRRTLAALVEQLEGLARQKPVLLLFEDAHWADASTLEVLDLLVQAIRHLPVLMLITHRTEFEPSWTGLPHATSLSLGRLEPEEARAIIGSLATGRQLPDQVVDHILTKTDGIPLFIEELTRTVLESGFLTDAGDISSAAFASIAIPSTLQDSLMARLDRLSPVREIAQVGAAIGREFSYALLQAVADGDGPVLQAALEQLEKAGLLFRTGTPPDARYQFKHALVQDAAYESMLKSRRVILHRRIAETLRDRFTTIAETQPELVARHFTQAALTEPAVEWLSKAGAAAQQRSAYVEASMHYQKAIELAETLQDGSAHRQRRLKLQLSYGQTLISLRGYAALETATAFARARELAAEIEDPNERLSVTYGLWVSNHVRGEGAPAREAAAAFLRDAEKLPGAPELGIAHRAIGMNHALAGELADARRHIEQAVAISDPGLDAELRARFGLSPSVTARIHLALVLWQLGEISRARMLVQQGLDYAARSGHVPTMAFGYGITCIFDAMRRDSLRVLENAEALVTLSLAHNLHSSWLPDGVFFRDWARWWSGDRSAGTTAMHETIRYFRAQGLLMYLGLYRELLAETELDAGHSDIADALIEDAFVDVEQTGLRWFEPELHRRGAEIALRRDPSDAAHAEEGFDRALAIAHEQQATSFELRAALGLCRLRQSRSKQLLPPIVSRLDDEADMPEMVQARRLVAD